MDLCLHGQVFMQGWCIFMWNGFQTFGDLCSHILHMSFMESLPLYTLSHENNVVLSSNGKVDLIYNNSHDSKSIHCSFSFQKIPTNVFNQMEAIDHMCLRIHSCLLCKPFKISSLKQPIIDCLVVCSYIFNVTLPFSTMI